MANDNDVAVPTSLAVSQFEARSPDTRIVIVIVGATIVFVSERALTLLGASSVGRLLVMRPTPRRPHGRPPGRDPGGDGAARTQLWLEITETTLVHDLERATLSVHQIRDLGVSISIDDFGTGWASLTYLRQFPVNSLKIDRLFTTGLGRRTRDAAIAHSIISLAAW